MAIKKSDISGLQIEPLKQGRITLRMIGNTPLYFNSYSSKAQRDLLLGSAKKTAAEKKEIKHDPEHEFRESVYTQVTGETLLCFPAPGVKGAMATAALETPGVTKSSVNRLIFLPQEKINIWGRPFMKMDVVRSADVAKTPDIRTRAFLPRWCAEIEIAYVMPSLSVHSVISLLRNAGIVVGIGDFRQEKGRGSFGSFSVAGVDDMGDLQSDWDSITLEGREVQVEAMKNPVPANNKTSSLLQRVMEERERRTGAAEPDKAVKSGGSRRGKAVEAAEAE